MAEIAFPSAAVVAGLDLGTTWPGRITHTVPASGDEVVIDRGRPKYSGTVTIAETEVGEDSRAVEAWIAQMGQHENFTELPLESRASSFTATTASSVSGAVATLAALPSGLGVNAYVRSGSRLLQVVALAVSTREATLWPAGVVEAGDPISPAASVRIRLLGKTTSAPSSGGFAGPWKLAWLEAV